MDVERRMVIASSDGVSPVSTRDAAELLDTFQWPPSADEIVVDVTRSTEPVEEARAGLTGSEQPPDATVEPDDRILRSESEKESATPFEALQDLVRHRTAAATGEGRVQGPDADVRAPGYVPVDWLRAHLMGLASACVLLALFASLEAVYILRTRLPRTTASPSAITAGPSSALSKTTASNDVGGGLNKASAASPAAGSARTGRLSIRSEPSGARVSIEGRSYGVTPLMLSSLEPGDYRVVVTREGKTVKDTVHVDAEGTASLVVPMAQGNAAPAVAPGWIAIASPLALDILEGGVLRGTTRSPQVMLAAGLHTLRFVNEMTGYDHVQQIRIEPGRVSQVQVNLPESLAHFNALPWARVWIDGVPIGETPIGNLPVKIGTHEILFRHPELGEKKMSALVKAGVPARVTVDMRK